MGFMYNGLPTMCHISMANDKCYVYQRNKTWVTVNYENNHNPELAFGVRVLSTLEQKLLPV